MAEKQCLIILNLRWIRIAEIATPFFPPPDTYLQLNFAPERVVASEFLRLIRDLLSNPVLYSCLAIITSTSFRELLRATYVILRPYIRRTGSRQRRICVPESWNNGSPVYMEFPCHKAAGENDRARKIARRPWQKSRERNMGRRHDLLNSAPFRPWSVRRDLLSRPFRPTYVFPPSRGSSLGSSLPRKLPGNFMAIIRIHPVVRDRATRR